MIFSIPLIFILSAAEANIFCERELQCGNKVNTACLLQPCGPSDACGEIFNGQRLNQEARDWVLELHNVIRSKIALGVTAEGGNSRAANMNELYYDEELEYVAQCWANYCLKDGFSSAHDSCRKTSKFLYPGQNMYWKASSGSFINVTDLNYIETAIQNWYNEINKMEGYIIDSFQNSPRGVIGHYTQMIWATTTHIGCAKTTYGSSNYRQEIFYCNYGEGGNIIGQPVYKRGEPCSQCESGICSEQYQGLCATDDGESNKSLILKEGDSKARNLGTNTIVMNKWLQVIGLLVTTLNYLKKFTTLLFKVILNTFHTNDLNVLEESQFFQIGF